MVAGENQGEPPMYDLGIKKLSPENWLKPDLASTVWTSRIDAEGVHLIDVEDRLREILEPTLDETVPDEVRRLFEVARGALAYGWFFYPLYKLASEQLYRVADAATAHKCREMRAPNSRDTFSKRIDWLVENGVISEPDKFNWDTTRLGRNLGSHPERQNIGLPGGAMRTLRRMAERINALFTET
jgi:hypothetical protein